MIEIIEGEIEGLFNWIERGGNEDDVRDQILRLLQIKQMINLNEV